VQDSKGFRVPAAAVVVIAAAVFAEIVSGSLKQIMGSANKAECCNTGKSDSRSKAVPDIYSKAAQTGSAPTASEYKHKPAAEAVPYTSKYSVPAAISADIPCTGAAPVPYIISKPAAKLSDDEIISKYKSHGMNIVEIRNAGEHTLVHYYKPTNTDGEIISRFDWLDRTTGLRELVYGWVYTDKFEITADKTLTVLTTGVSHVDGGQWFPRIHKSGYSKCDGANYFYESEDGYYMPIENSITLGKNRRECLTSINFNLETISLGFNEQPGYEAEFHAAVETIPEMNIKCENGLCTITLYNTILSEGFKAPDAGTGDVFCSFLSVTCDGTDTVITLKLGDIVGRYNVSTNRSPADDLPYAIFEFVRRDNYSYPTGW
jgi:hypothetical protein